MKKPGAWAGLAFKSFTSPQRRPRSSDRSAALPAFASVRGLGKAAGVDPPLEPRVAPGDVPVRTSPKIHARGKRLAAFLFDRSQLKLLLFVPIHIRTRFDLRRMSSKGSVSV